MRGLLPGLTAITRTGVVTRVRVAALLTCALLAAGCGSDRGFPSRPLTMIVPWGAGGGTDAVARIMASQMEAVLGQPVNVVNRTGGSGVVGHQSIAGAAPDGYTVGIITTEIAMMRHLGLTDLNGDSFTPLGLINFDATAIQVRASSPYQSLADLLDAVRANPGRLKASGTAQGGIWHVSLYGLLQEQNIPPSSVVWVPSASSAAGLLDLVAGGVDMVPCSHPEARSLIDAGRVRSLAILDDTPSSLYPDVPLGSQQIGTSWTMGVWRGIGAPRDLPVDVRTRLEEAVAAAYNSPAYQEFMSTRGFGTRWAGPAEFARFMREADGEMGAVMKAVGLAP